jgi:hypothetical protein
MQKLKESSMQNEIKQYQIGDPLITTGEKIVAIIGQNNNCGVYITEGKKVKWEWYAQEPEPETPRIEYSCLVNIILTTIKKNNRDNYRTALGTAMMCSLCAKSKKEQIDAFSELSNRLLNLRQKLSRNGSSLLLA